jgi:DNA-binding MarR family transcriptional regulator
MGKEDTIQEIIEGLSRLHRPLDGDGWRELGLSHAQVGMLYMLSCHDNPSPKQVASYLGITQSAVSQLIDPLLDKGYVSRHMDPTDRRISRLSLTKKGADFLRKIRKLKTAGLRAALENLSAQDVKKLEKIISRMTVKAAN